jgi:membrane associated rhomboid family serine protease
MMIRRLLLLLSFVAATIFAGGQAEAEVAHPLMMIYVPQITSGNIWGFLGCCAMLPTSA